MVGLSMQPGVPAEWKHFSSAKLRYPYGLIHISVKHKTFIMLEKTATDLAGFLTKGFEHFIPM